jgi:hypothetical protein
MFRRKQDTEANPDNPAAEKQLEAKNRTRATKQVVEERKRVQSEVDARLETATQLVHELLAKGEANGDGVEGLEGTPPIFLEGLSNYHITVTGQFNQGATIVSRWTVHGDHAGEILGAPPTWQEITVSGVMILEIGGKQGFRRGWIFWDLPGLMERLGLQS